MSLDIVGNSFSVETDIVRENEYNRPWFRFPFSAQCGCQVVKTVPGNIVSAYYNRTEDFFTAAILGHVSKAKHYVRS